MRTIQTARHAAHASAHDHPGRFYSGLAVVALGAGLWLAEVARMLGQVIKSGPVVQIRDGNGNVSVFEDDDGGAQTYAGPMAVLITHPP